MIYNNNYLEIDYIMDIHNPSRSKYINIIESFQYTPSNDFFKKSNFFIKILEINAVEMYYCYAWYRLLGITSDKHMLIEYRQSWTDTRLVNKNNILGLVKMDLDSNINSIFFNEELLSLSNILLNKELDLGFESNIYKITKKELNSL